MKESRGEALTLPPGTRLGPYEIVSLLGSGGMGDVYRARDARLGRDVALKVLPGRADDDSGRFRRFQTEAKAAASLSHPHIVAVHDVGQDGGTAYIVSELVPGGTLTTLLDRGPLQTRRLLDLAVSLAEALAAAHANGIVHRDLKPDNVLLGPDGAPKIADFGLAKYLAPVSSDGDTKGTTLDDERTREGSIFGTVGYMSPEQAEGKPLDFRSDQFSFGSVLYEMATGTRSFQRSTAVDTLAAILHDEPRPIEATNSRIPRPLRWTIARCLAKDPDGRYASTADLARELATLREHLSEAAAGDALARVLPRERRVLPTALAAAAVLAAGLFAGRNLWKPQPAAPPSFQQLTFRRGNLQQARYTPDGGSIIYGAAWDGNPAEIFTARLDGTESRPFGIRHADVLSVSSKGEVAVLLKGTLAVVSLAGGTPRELLEHVVLADWSPDGTQLAVARRENGETRIEYPIGRVLCKVKNQMGEWMRVSGDGNRVVFVENDPAQGNDLKIVDTRGKTTNLLHVPDPEFIGGLLWQPGDREIVIGLNREGDPRGDVGGLASVDMSGHVRTLYRGAIELLAQDSRPDGRFLVSLYKGSAGLMFGSATAAAERDLGWLTDSFLDDLSEDGAMLLFHDNTNTYLRRTDGSPAIRLGAGFFGTLSPDGKYAVVRTRAEHEISIIPIGPGQIRTVSIGDLTLHSYPKLLPDGRTLVFGATDRSGQARLYVLDDPAKAPRPISDPITPLQWTVLSPDAREIAVPDSTRGLEIFRIDGGPSRAVAGLEPGDDVLAWSGDGNFLYVARQGNLPLNVDRFELATGRKQPWKSLFPSDATGVYWAGSASITRDGKFWAYQASRTSSDELWQMTGLSLH